MAPPARLGYPSTVGRQLAWLVVMALGGCTEMVPPAETPDAVAPSVEGPAETRPAAPDIGFWVGEQLLAEITIRGITIGEYRMWVAAPCALDDHPVIPVVSKARRTGIYGAFSDSGGEAMSWLDPQSGHPLQSRSRVESRRSVKHYLITFLEGHLRTSYRRQWKTSTRAPYHLDRLRKVPPHTPVHDMHSALGLLRRWSAQPGKRGTLHVVFGSRLQQVNALVQGREQVLVGGSTFDAIRIDGTVRLLRKDLTLGKRVRNWVLWVSDEPARLPLKAQFETRKGIVEAELSEYEQTSADPLQDLSPCIGAAPSTAAQ